MDMKEKIKELFTTKLDRNLTKKVRIHCAKNKMKIQDFIEQSLTDSLSKGSSK